jgi:hypothetical protein
MCSLQLLLPVHLRESMAAFSSRKDPAVAQATAGGTYHQLVIVNISALLQTPPAS